MKILAFVFFTILILLPCQVHSSPTNPFANVIDYGAIPNDNIDDTSAIQAAINANAGPVFLPAGKYLACEIELQPGTVIFGSGSGSPPHIGTRINQKSGCNSDVFIAAKWLTPTDWLHWVQIKDMQIYGDKTNNTSGSGINIIHPTGENFRLENLLISNFPEDGIRLANGATPGSIENVAGFNNEGYAINLERDGSHSWNKFSINNVSGDNNGIALIRVAVGGTTHDLVTISNVKSETSAIGRQQDVIHLENMNGMVVSISNVSVVAQVPMNAVVRMNGVQPSNPYANSRIIANNWTTESNVMYFIDDHCNCPTGKLLRTRHLISGFWDSHSQSGIGQTNMLLVP